MYELFTKEDLLNVYNKLKSNKILDRNKKLPIGIDGVSSETFERNLDFSLSEIHRKLLVVEGMIRYKFSPLLRIERTKIHGGIRALHIPRLRDQIVLRLLHDEINRLAAARGIETRIRSPYSFVVKLHELIDSRERSVILRTDISRFYDSVPRRQAVENCLHIGMKQEVFDFLNSWSDNLRIREGFFNFNLDVSDYVGLPQGLSISSILAEIYVKQIDFAFEGESGYFRYIDDIIIVCDDAADAYKKLEKLRSVTESINLRLSSNKTEIVDISDGLEWLGLIHFKGNIQIDSSKLIRTMKPISSMKRECLQEIQLTQLDEEKRKSINRLIKRIDKFVSGRNNVKLRWYCLCTDLGQWKKIDSYIHGHIDSCIRRAGYCRQDFKDFPSIHAKILGYRKKRGAAKTTGNG